MVIYAYVSLAFNDKVLTHFSSEQNTFFIAFRASTNIFSKF
jgi:hypothetical protein